MGWNPLRSLVRTGGDIVDGDYGKLAGDVTNVALDPLNITGGAPGKALDRLGNGVVDQWTGKDARDDINGGLDSQIAAEKTAQGTILGARDANIGVNTPMEQLGMNSAGNLSTLANTPTQQDQYTNQEQQPGAYQDKGFNFQADPGYEFRKQQALDSTMASAAARGNLAGGSTLEALAKRSGQMASDEYGNAFNRYANQRDFGYNANQDQLGQYNKNRDFGYGQVKDRNNFRMDDVKNRTAGLSTLVNSGNLARGNISDAYTKYGDQSAGLTTGLSNAQVAASIAKASARNQSQNSILDFGGKIIGAGAKLIGGA